MIVTGSNLYLVPLKVQIYISLNELVSAPYKYRIFNLTLKPNFSKTTRQKLKVKLYSDRARSVL